jgi:hypothetical protein
MPGHLVTVSALMITFPNFRSEALVVVVRNLNAIGNFKLGCIKTAHCPLWFKLTSILMSVCVQSVGG